MLSAEALAIGYAKQPPLGRDIDLLIEPGQIFCLLGPNGCGKTTLLKTLLGLLPPRAGRVCLNNVDLRTLSRRQLAHRLAYVPQASAGYFPYTVLDTVLMGRTAHLGAFAAPARKDREQARQALAVLGIAELATAVYTRLSGGQRQLVLIARALAQQPDLLIMDEPTASLDFGNQARVLTQIRQLAQQGMGIVFSTHDPAHALTYADRVAMLANGRLLAYGVPDTVISPTHLRTLYGIDVMIKHLPEVGRSVCLPLNAGLPR